MTPKQQALGAETLQRINTALEEMLGQPNADEAACESVGLTYAERSELALDLAVEGESAAIEADATWHPLVEQVPRKRAEAILRELLDTWYGLAAAEMIQEHIGDAIKAMRDDIKQSLARAAPRRANEEIKPNTRTFHGRLDGPSFTKSADDVAAGLGNGGPDATASRRCGHRQSRCFTQSPVPAAVHRRNESADAGVI